MHRITYRSAAIHQALSIRKGYSNGSERYEAGTHVQVAVRTVHRSLHEYVSLEWLLGIQLDPPKIEFEDSTLVKSEKNE